MKVGDKRTKLISALDLGQVQDHTAWVVLERTSTLVRIRPFACELEYSVRHMVRFPLGTAYGEIFTALRERYSELPLKETMLVIDQTCVGKAVVDLFRKTRIPCQTQPVVITAASKESFDVGCFQVPKMNLVSLLQVMLQNRQLKIPSDLKLATVLAEELQHFQMKPQLHSDTPDLTWRERPHDDLVLAVALACWYAEREQPEHEWFPHMGVPRAYELGRRPWVW